MMNEVNLEMRKTNNKIINKIISVMIQKIHSLIMIKHHSLIMIKQSLITIKMVLIKILKIGNLIKMEVKKAHVRFKSRGSSKIISFFY